MKRYLGLVAAALLVFASIGVATAQVPSTTITVPSGATGTVTAYVNGQACGSTTVTATAGGTISLPAGACSTAGSNVTFTLGGAALAGTVTVPAAGGTTALANLNLQAPATPVTIVAPAVPGGGTLNVLVNGQACGTIALSATGPTTLTLPAGACSAVASNVTFTLGGASVGGTLIIPAAGGALTITSLQPVACAVTISVPASATGAALGTLTVLVNGQSAGTLSVSGTGGTTFVIGAAGGAACPPAGATITFRTTAGQTLTQTFTATPGGTATLSSFALQPIGTGAGTGTAPTPAATGSGGYLDQDEGGVSLPFIATFALIGFAAIGSGIAAARALRR